MDKEVREKKFLLAQSHSIRTRNKKRKKTLTQMLQDYKTEKEQIFSECYNLHEVI
jgi:hypothetical protein